MTQRGMRWLGELEAEVMKRLWTRAAPAAVRDVFDDLRRERTIAYTTVMTVLDNLYRKGWVRRELEGRAYRYEPIITAEEYSAELMRRALGASGDPVSAFTHFLRRMSPEEMRALDDAYDRLAGRREAGSNEAGTE
jgi:predicted transcriptional regulator